MIGDGGQRLDRPRRSRRAAPNSQTTASNGNTLITTVTSDSPPAARTPMALTPVRTTSQPIATGDGIVGLDEVGSDERHGRRRRDRDRTPARSQFETQKLQADQEAGGGPEFLLDIGLDAAAAERRQPAEADKRCR